MLVGEPIMTMGSTPTINGLNGTSQAGRHRLTFDDPLTTARAAPVVREVRRRLHDQGVKTKKGKKSLMPSFLAPRKESTPGN